MIVAQLSDTHLLSINDKNEIAKLRADNLRAAVTAINDLVPLVDAVIHTGDMTHTHAPDEYGLAREIMSALRSPLYVVPGNRDSRTSLRQTFIDDGYLKGYHNEPILYSIDRHAVRLIGYDSLSETSNMGNIDKYRLNWLDSALSDYPERPTVIFMHHPPVLVTTSKFPWAYDNKEAGENLAAIVSRHPQVVRLFCGHSHRPFIASFAGTEASTVPSIATDLRQDPYPKALTHTPVFQVHKMDKNGNFLSESHTAGMQHRNDAMSASG